ncbi:MAG: urease accessory protein UreF [Thermoleophilia bacterium]|nr:urease accessory protein UreF [Thermoleophilia bacterium]
MALRLDHLQLLDSALPVGAFAHSWGLEAGVDCGAVATANDLERYVLGQLHARWAPFDALLVASVHRLGAAGEFDRLWAMAERAHAMSPASRSREANVAIGRRLLRLLPQLHPDMELLPLSIAVAYGCPPLQGLVHGWATWRLGIDRDDAARGWLHASVTASVQAAVRLMSLGQTDAQRVVARALPEIDLAWERVRERAPEELSASAVESDVWALRQPRLDGRLFMS